jgi:hypothetical protein
MRWRALLRHPHGATEKQHDFTQLQASTTVAPTVLLVALTYNAAHGRPIAHKVPLDRDYAQDTFTI